MFKYLFFCREVSLAAWGTSLSTETTSCPETGRTSSTHPGMISVLSLACWLTGVLPTLANTEEFANRRRKISTANVKILGIYLVNLISIQTQIKTFFEKYMAFIIKCAKILYGLLEWSIQKGSILNVQMWMSFNTWLWKYWTLKKVVFKSNNFGHASVCLIWAKF